MLFFNSKKTIGLDLGSSSIKLAEISVSKGIATLENFAFVQTPQAGFVNGDITDTYLIGESVKSLHKEQKFSRKNACIGMWGSSTIVKRITMPKTDAKSLKDQIKYEAQQYLPFDISQVTLEYHVLPFSTSSDQMDILIVAGQNESISKYIEVAAYAELKSSIIDVSSIALANIFEFNYGKFSEPIGLFNFGSNSTQFVVVFQGEVIFARDIPVGGFHFTNEIAKNMGVTQEEAEGLKMAQSAQTEVPENTRTFMNMALDYVTEEIRNSIDFYSASSSDLYLSRIYYTGGASLTSGLIDHLADALKMNFESLNPLINVRSGNKKLNPHYLTQITPFIAVSLGLALRETGDS
jgi:type IV pilus assembly protein PilM